MIGTPVMRELMLKVFFSIDVIVVDLNSELRNLLFEVEL